MSAPFFLSDGPLTKLVHACRADGTSSIIGVGFQFEDDRLWVCFRGDRIGNWREAGEHLVFENAVGELAVARSVDVALDITLGELCDHLPDNLVQGSDEREH